MKTSCRFAPFPIQSRAGFTLIELFAVITAVAVLAVVLLPALAGTKPNTRAFQCMNNERQLVLGWQMYANDNQGILAQNDFPWLTAYRGQTPATQAEMRNWVVGTMTESLDANSSSAQSIAELSDPNTELSPYVKNYKVYHCPADNYSNPLDSGHVNLRSCSMNSAVGTIGYAFYISGSPPLNSPVQGGWLPGSAYNPSQTAWLTYGKTSSFSRPGPANTFVIIDENPFSIDDGLISIPAFATPGSTYLIDFPSGLHGAAGVISFADGHVIVYKWLDRRTYTPQGLISGGQGGAGSYLQTPDNPDCFYLASITSAPR